MQRLPSDWLTQGLVDFEYKKYILLAYLKQVRSSFDRIELYPYLADMVFHYRNMLAIKDNKALIRESFPKEISLEDFNKLELVYRKMINDDSVMAEIEAILDFAIPQMKESLQEGSVIYEYVESQCEISPVGVTPLYAREGYLFVAQPPEKDTEVYRYQVSIFDGSQEQMQSLNTEHIETWNKTSVSTYESLKLNLIRRYRDLPNPATYLVLSRMRFPYTQTLMPVVKRLFVKHISLAA